MISKAKYKLIQSLAKKKKRDELGLFIAESDKLFIELLNGEFEFQAVYATKTFIEKYELHRHSINSVLIETEHQEIKKASLLQTPQQVLAIVKQKRADLDLQSISQSLTIALDGVQDPGNFGTIVRTANWFGIKHVLCSKSCVDLYNPKSIQATMGAITSVDIHVVDLPETLSKLQEMNTPLYATFLEGEDIYTTELSQSGVIVMGNEGQGVSETVKQLIDKKLYIPPYPKNAEAVESLNVSIATAVVCSEFRRRS